MILIIIIIVVNELITHLALVRHAGVEPVVQSVALEVDVLGYAIVERITAEVVAVKLAR